MDCRRNMRRRRSIATRDMKHDTSLRKFFEFGAIVPAVLLATWCYRPPSMTGESTRPQR